MNFLKNRGWWVIGGLLVLLIVVAATTLPNIERGVPQSESAVSEVLERPEDFYGRTIVLTGEVEEVIGPRAFTLDSPGPLSEKLLVVSRNVLQPIGGETTQDFFFETDDRVSVKGEVRQFNLRELEQSLGVDLVDEEFAQWEGKPIILAQEIEAEEQ